MKKIEVTFHKLSRVNNHKNEEQMFNLEVLFPPMAQPQNPLKG